MITKNCKKREAREKINLARNYFNESSYSLMKYHLRYCTEKLLSLEQILRSLQSKKKKFKFTSVKRPGKDYIPTMLKEKEIGQDKIL